MSFVKYWTTLVPVPFAPPIPPPPPLPHLLLSDKRLIVLFASAAQDATPVQRKTRGHVFKTTFIVVTQNTHTHKHAHIYRFYYINSTATGRTSSLSSSPPPPPPPIMPYLCISRLMYSVGAGAPVVPLQLEPRLHPRIAGGLVGSPGGPDAVSHRGAQVCRALRPLRTVT